MGLFFIKYLIYIVVFSLCVKLDIVKLWWHKHRPNKKCRKEYDLFYAVEDVICLAFSKLK